MCHIRVHTLLPVGVDRTVRVGWRPGCPLVLPDGAVSLPPRHDSEEIIEEPADKKAKRAKINVPLEGIAYYFDYVDSMNALYGWSAQRSFRSLQECAPEIYGSVHHCTPIRWKRPHSKEVDEDGLAPRGRRRKVPAAAMLRFMELAQRVTAQLAVPSATLKSLFERQLEDMGTPQTLCSLGPTFSQRVQVHVQVEQPKWIGEDDRSVKHKVHFLRHWQSDTPIPWTRVWNLDQTSLLLLPTRKKGWSPVGQASSHVGDDKANITACLVMGTAPGQLLCQLIFHGKTSRSLPTCEIPSNIKLTVSENHWSTLATMDQVMGDIDHIMNPAGTREPLLLLLDVRPIHVSKQYRSMVRDKYEHVRLAFVPPGTTCVAQPLDVAMMRLFKSGLREAAAADMSRMLLDAVVDNQPDLHKTMKNALLKRKIVGWIEVAMRHCAHRDTAFEKAWRHVVVTDEDSGSVLEMAMTDYHAGSMFQNNRGIVPEQVPSHEEHDMSPEHLAAILDDEGNVFDDDDQDPTEMGEQAAETPAAPAVAEHPPETPAVAEASTVIEIPRERETPRERMLKRLNALRIVHGSRPPK